MLEASSDVRLQQLTPDQYRERWGLPADYPMVSPQLRSAAQHAGEVDRPRRTRNARPRRLYRRCQTKPRAAAAGGGGRLPAPEVFRRLALRAAS